MSHAARLPGCSAGTPIPRRRLAKQLALAAMLCAVSMTFIDQTIVAIASPTIQQQLDLSRSGTQWVVNAYLLTLAAMFALGGRLADVLGSRRMVLIGIIGFAVCSALCGATPKGSDAEAWLVFFRALQGVSGAIMVPAALAVVVTAFPEHERGRALAIFFGISGGLTAVGPIAGGALTQWTWRAIFWINIPVAVVAVVLALTAEISPVRRADRIDLRGAVLIAVGMSLSVLGFEQAQTWGWRSPATWACVVGGLAVLTIFFRVQLHTPSPLVQVRIFRDRAFLVDNGILFFAMIAFVPVFFFASVYAQVSLGYDANKAGLFLLVFFAGFGTAAQLGGRMLDSRGARRPMVLGSALGCAGFALWAAHLNHFGLDAQWPYVVLSGAGIGLLLGPASTDAVNRSLEASYGEVTGITQTVRNYASTLGLAVLGTVLTMVMTSRLTTTLARLGLPHTTAARIAHATARNGSAGGGVPAPVRNHLQTAIAHDFAHATEAVFNGMAAALGLCFLVALCYPRAAVPLDEERHGNLAPGATQIDPVKPASSSAASS